MKKLFVLFVLFLVGCSNTYIDLPPGNTGRKLTPKGWENTVLKPGQVDVGIIDAHGMGNKLVTISAGSITVKEEFTLLSNGEDHRLNLKNQTPVSCDVYLQLVAPDPDTEKADYEMCYTLVEPEVKTPRWSHIDIEKVYDRFAQSHVRGGIRGIGLQYADFDKFNLANAIPIDGQECEFNRRISALVLKVFKENKVPLRVLSISVSNIKQDQIMKDAAIKAQAVDAELERDKKRIQMIGEQIRQNPEAVPLLVWDKLGEVIDKSKGSGHIFIVNMGDSPQLLDGMVGAKVIQKTTETKKLAEKPEVK